MTRRNCFVSIALALAVSSVPSTASADPIRLIPTAVGELVDRAPIDGADLEIFLNSQNVSLGPSAETRAFYEFSLAGVRINSNESAAFSVSRGAPFSECSSLSPCPELSGIDVYGYAGDGAVTLADYGAGILLGTVTPVPLEGGRLTLDVSRFVGTLVSQRVAFAGIALRAGSQGGAGFQEAQLGVVPEPSTLALVLTAGIGCLGRHWRRRKPQDEPAP